MPYFNTLGIRSTKKKAYEDKLHLVDKECVRMGQYILKYFLAKRREKGPLV